MGQIVYENKDVIIYNKAPGEDSEKLTGILGREVYVINRLDKPVRGLVCLALNPKAAAFINSQVQDKTFKKTYYAVIQGVMEEPKGELKDLLYHDRRANKSYPVKKKRNGVKDASLDYETLQTFENEGEMYSMVRVHLHTGRTHQIRVQFSSRKHPLAGDGKYGSRVKCDVKLLSGEVSFVLPGEKNPKVFEIKPDETFIQF